MIRIFAVAFTCLFPILSPAGDWPNWRGPDRNGISQETIPENLPTELPIAWRAKIGIGFCSISVLGERVVTMGNSDDHDTIWCLSAADGRVLWQHTYPCPLDPLYYEGGPGGTPTIYKGRVYTLSKKGHAFCLDLETGEVIWSRDLIGDHSFKLPEWSFASSPYIADDKVIHNVGRGGIALDLATGETLWAPSTETSGYATIVAHQDYHLLFSAKALIAINTANGQQLWEYPWKSSRDVNAADPVSLGERIIVSSSAGTSLLDTSSNPPAEIWKQHDMKWYFNPGVVIEGYAYSIHGTTHRPTEIICTDVATGDIVWSEAGYGSGGLIAASDTIIVFDKGILTLLDASSDGFQLRHRQTLLEGKCWTTPVLAHGQIYCRNAEGDLVCVTLQEKD